MISSSCSLKINTRHVTLPDNTIQPEFKY